MAKKKDDDDEHGWAAPAGRYPNDDLLRKHGFQIHSRVRKRENLVSSWTMNGKVYTEEEALKMVGES